MDLANVIDASKIDRIPKATLVGIDIGSRQSKAAMLHNGQLFVAIRPTGYVMQDVADELLKQLMEESSVSIADIDYIVSTGYGRVALDFNTIPNKIVTEIACHGMGAHFMGHDIHTIIDIGGQDSKAIRIDPDTGKVTDFAMNDKCAAGTGRFLERIAKVLEMDTTTIGPVSLQAKNPVDISAQCIVFAESEVVSDRAEGRDVADIAAGIHASVARRVYSLLSRVGIEKNVLFTGGVSNNPGIVKAFEDLLGFSVSTAKLDTVYAGALGAAVLAGQYLGERRLDDEADGDLFTLDISSIENAMEYEKDLIIRKKTGKKKTVAYTCAYVPIELLASAGVSHYRIMHAGNQDEVMAGESITQSVFCDLSKSVIGGFANETPIFKAVDHVYSFYTCDCMRKTIEAVDSNFVPATIYNMPRLRKDEESRRYYMTELVNFKRDLETLIGTPIEDAEIQKNIALYNEAKKLLREISSYRKLAAPLVTGKQFERIARAYYYLPIDTLLSELNKILVQLREYDQNNKETRKSERYRIMLSGGVLADGDEKITGLLYELGADIVAEDNCTGLKPFLHTVPETGEWAEDLADGYLGQAPCAKMKPLNDMVEHSIKLAQEYQAEAVVLYYLKFCPCYSMILRKVTDALEAAGIPVLVVGSDYSKGDEGQIKIRVEAFLEMLGQNREV
ncbi:MAG: acyl-CoA dehydratase activase [Clostridia bacterium]|nr:acyl-CoA dehydratase activase [Clostridia bacterium]